MKARELRTRTMYLVLALVALLSVVLLTAFRFLFQGEPPTSFDSLTAILVWLSVGGGGMWLVGYVESYLLENAAWWHNLPHWFKVVAPVFIAGLVGSLAQSAINLDVLSGVPTMYQGFILSIVNYLATQRAYMGLQIQGAYGESARQMAASKAEDG